MFEFLSSLADFRDERKQRLHIILLSFIVSFILAHILTLQIGGEWYIRGYHIHHFYWGMIALSVGAVVGILDSRHRTMQIASVLVGSGIGVFADEIGLLLNCTSPARACQYFFADTYDIVFSIGIAIVLIIVLVEVLLRYQQRKPSAR